MTKLRVTLGGRTFNVLVEVLEDSAKPAEPPVRKPVVPRETAALSLGPVPHVLAAAPKDSAAGASDPGTVLSPLAGKVVSIDVNIGQTVAEGAQVATIEAMKMNTFIFAPIAGKVTSIEAASGDAVEEGAILLRIG